MRFRSKLLMWWTGVVILLLAGMFFASLHTIQVSFDRIGDANFVGMRQGLRTLQAERVRRMCDAGAMVMNIPELRALIAEHNYEVSSDNLASLQERLDSLAQLVGVDAACVLDNQGALIAQNNGSPWRKLKDLSDYFASSPEGPAMVRGIYEPAGKARPTGETHGEQGIRNGAQVGLWVYHGKLYQVVGLPLVFGDGEEGDASPSGALILATAWTDQLASDLGGSGHCEIGFLSGDSILACSLAPSDRTQLVEAYDRERWPMEAPFTVRLSGIDYRSSLEPLMDQCSGRQVATMLIQSSQNEGAAIRRTVLRNLSVTAGAGLLVAAALSILLSGAITRPVHQLVDGVKRVAGGDLDSTLRVNRRDELGELATAFNDMVTQLRTRRELQRLVEESQAASKAKSQFLANMSHELRTPLHGVLGITNLLLGTELNDRQRHYTELVRTSTQVLTTLINDLLDFSKIEAGKLELESIDFNVHSVTEDVVELMSRKAFSKGVEIASDISLDVPMTVRGDATRLRQILLNLTGNAIKFTNAGHIVVRVTRDACEDGKLAVRFAVIDTGIGIPPERQDRLFKSFSQGDASTTRRYGGTGLGLAISKQLAELMGGSIGVQSSAGMGSTFWFTVKLDAPEGLAPAAFDELRGRRVVTLIPNQTVSEIVVRQLTEAGMTASATVDCQGAKKTLGESSTSGQPFDLIVVDQQTPGVGSLFAEIESIACVLLTSDEDSLADSGQCPADVAASAVKPVRRSQLLLAISSALNSTRQESRPESLAAAAPLKQATGRTRFKILVAEDNEINQIVALDLLEKFGFQATVVGDGRSAVKAVAEGNYDLVLMDCQMPLMDGLEASRAIRDYEKARSAAGKSGRAIPIVALTANASGEDRDRCREAGMNGYCQKPFKPEELLDAVKSFLSDNPKEATEMPPMDVKSLLERCTGNSTLALTILQKFEKQTGTLLLELETGLREKNVEQCARLSHSLKGSAGIVGAESVRAAAAGLETASRSNALETVEAGLANLREEVRRCFDYLPNARLELQGKPAGS
jgi:two-component system sensor histidine kinase/response regulator